MGAQMVNTLWLSLLEYLMNLGGSSVMPVLEQVSGSSNTFSMFLYASILAPIWEELLFRGCILRGLRPFGKQFAVLGSALLFGLFHGNLLQAPYALVVGLLLGYVTVEYSIVWSIALHMFNNLVLADLLSRLTVSWSEMAYGVLSLILFGGSALASVVLLVVNRDKIRDYRQREWVDRRCLKCFFTNAGMLTFLVVMFISMALMFFV
jgi:membrane protease YdiL (CAAX protease family)